MKDGDNGRDVMSNTMRVLGNYTLPEGIMAGSLWTIDDQNHYISCEQNIRTRLEEHTHTNGNTGDALMQGDMAVTTTLCHYSEQSSKYSENGFAVGTQNCIGMKHCQFPKPDEAVHFCNAEPECTMIMGKVDDSGCDGGLGCYTPMKGVPETNTSWSDDGGRSYVKHCPGALLETQTRIQQGVRDSGSRWHNGEVAYCFSAETPPAAKEAFQIAVEQMKRQVPCLNFQLADRIDDTRCATVPSIMVTADKGGCWSYLGQVSGKEKMWEKLSQPLNLDRGCELPGMALHQLGHALGMAHTNSRADRDKVLQMNETNIQSGKLMQFGMSQDVVKFAWSGSNMCVQRAGQTRTQMTSADCAAVQGLPVVSGAMPADDELIECEMDLCEDGKYRPAPTNLCKDKVANFSLKMQIGDCKTSRGTPDSEGEYFQWTNCHFDLCTDMGLHLAKPLTCANKLAHGYIQVQYQQCQNMGGTSVAKDVGTEFVNCYFDFCSGEFDGAFDFLSLMMYSPHAWSHTGNELSLEPLGNHSEMIANIMGQRMGFSGMDVFHLGHMYNCWEQIKPDFDSKEVSNKIISGEFFEWPEDCKDQDAEHTSFEIHGESGFMKHASCPELTHLCDNETLGVSVRQACPVSCFMCMPNHGTTGGYGGSGKCFDADNTGIRFKDGPKATCRDLIKYCKHPHIGPQVMESCKLSCGGCQPHVYAPFYDSNKACGDLKADEDPQFTVQGTLAKCEDLPDFCQGHTDSYLIRHKCPRTCGICGGQELKPKKEEANEIYIPGDAGNCERRRRFGFCSSRRRRNV
jgi:hypothetical protein